MRKGAAAVAGVTAYAVCLAVYPVAALLALAVVLIAVIATRRPVLAILIAVLLFESAGVVKILLTTHGAPFLTPEKLGAAALDLGLLAAVAGVLWADRLATPRGIWANATRLERWLVGALVAWLAVSVVQIALAPSVSQGIEGFRLTQTYTLLLVPGAILGARFGLRGTAAGLLAVGGLLAAYAVLRTATGLSESERVYAIYRNIQYAYGSHFRSIGSVDSTVALASVLVPVFGLAAAIALAWKRWRIAALVVAGLSAIAAVFTYTRISLVAMALSAAAFAAALAVAKRPRLRSLALGGAIGVVVLGAVAGLVAVASTGSGASQHARGFIDPAGDRSLQERFDTWKQALDAFAARPLGRGVGTVGSAAVARLGPNQGGAVATTDNSFLKILVEQGVIGTPLFLAGVFGLFGIAMARAGRAPPRRRALILAALCGFLGFLLLWLAGDYIEQPGKVIAWLLLGMAVGAGFRESLGLPALAGPMEVRVRRSRSLLIGLAAGAAILVAVPVVLSLGRASSFQEGIDIFGPPAHGQSAPYALSLEALDAALAAPDIHTVTASIAGPDASDFTASVVAEPSLGDDVYRLTVGAATPDRVARVTTALAGTLAYRETLAVRAIANQRLEGPLTKREARAARHWASTSHNEVVLGRHTVPSPISRWGDRFANSLPGTFPPRSGPLFAALTGLAAALGLAAIWAFLSSPRKRDGSEGAIVPSGSA